jgi:hypothetical protein
LAKRVDPEIEAEPVPFATEYETVPEEEVLTDRLIDPPLVTVDEEVIDSDGAIGFMVIVWVAVAE